MSLLILLMVAISLTDSANGEPNASEGQGKADVQLPGAMICGPRCVQFICEYYGQQLDLIELVRRMQSPDLEKGCSLEDICRELKKQRINCVAIKIESDAVLKWPYPVIVHMAENYWERMVRMVGIGHFAVWLPSSAGGDVNLWLGPDQEKQMSETDFEHYRSGYVILTSLNPITDPGSAVKSNIRIGSSIAAYIAILVLAVCILALGYKAARNVEIEGLD